MTGTKRVNQIANVNKLVEDIDTGAVLVALGSEHTRELWDNREPELGVVDGKLCWRGWGSNGWEVVDPEEEITIQEMDVRIEWDPTL